MLYIPRQLKTITLYPKFVLYIPQQLKTIILHPIFVLYIAQQFISSAITVEERFQEHNRQSKRKGSLGIKGLRVHRRRWSQSPRHPHWL